MKRGDRRNIEVDRVSFEAEYLGKGRHARAYRKDDAVYLFVFDDGEYMKDVFEWVPEGTPHLPEVRQHDEGREGRKRYGRGRDASGRVYSMPYYRTITAADRQAWSVLKTLAESAERVRREKGYTFDKPLTVYGLYFFNDVIEDTRGRVPESVTEALEALMNAGSNYGCGVTCEFGKRNMGVDSQGRIVFRDILFDAEKLYRDNMARYGHNY